MAESLPAANAKVYKCRKRVSKKRDKNSPVSARPQLETKVASLASLKLGIPNSSWSKLYPWDLGAMPFFDETGGFITRYRSKRRRALREISAVLSIATTDENSVVLEDSSKQQGGRISRSDQLIADLIRFPMSELANHAAKKKVEPREGSCIDASLETVVETLPTWQRYRALDGVLCKELRNQQLLRQACFFGDTAALEKRWEEAEGIWLKKHP